MHCNTRDEEYYDTLSVRERGKFSILWLPANQPIHKMAVCCRFCTFIQLAPKIDMWREFKRNGLEKNLVGFAKNPKFGIAPRFKPSISQKRNSLLIAGHHHRHQGELMNFFSFFKKE